MPLLKTNDFYTTEYIYSLPDGERAELINGRIYNMAPPGRVHQKILGTIYNLISNYVKANNGSCEVYPAPFAVFLKADEETYVEPDISVICNPNKLTDKGCNGAPDWIIEIISPGNAGHDYVKKLNLYESAGVREYWIVDPTEERILVYFFEAEWVYRHYSFRDRVNVNIYQNFEIDFSNMI